MLEKYLFYYLWSKLNETGKKFVYVGAIVSMELLRKNDRFRQLLMDILSKRLVFCMVGIPIKVIFFRPVRTSYL